MPLIVFDLGGIWPSPFSCSPMSYFHIALFLVYTGRSLGSILLAYVSVRVGEDFALPAELAAMISVKKAMLTAQYS